jgi:HEXXH motif-containing protein
MVERLRTLAPSLGGDSGEVVTPRPPGQFIDLLEKLSLAKRADRAKQILQREALLARGDERACLAATGAALEELKPAQLIAAFRSPLAAFDLTASRASTDPRTSRQRALALARYVIGLRGLGGLTLVLPASSFTYGELVMPNLGVAIDGRCEPVAVEVSDQAILLTWADGSRATIPYGLLPLRGVDVSGLRSYGTIGDIAVLNDVPEVERAFGTWGLASGSAREKTATALGQGLGLLRRVWPAAAEMTQRFLLGVLLLNEREGTRSHSPTQLAGTVITSATDAVSSADILCHELAHIRMNILLEHDRLLEDDGKPRHVSPWRRDLRPLGGILMGVHAFLDVCSFYRRLEQAGVAVDIAPIIFDRQRGKVLRGMEVLLREASPTVVGARVIEELEREVARL